MFQATLAPCDLALGYRITLVGLFEPGALAVETLPPLSGHHLFAYLFRRFGPPNWSWDPTKYLVQYVLTTPLEGVLLTIMPHINASPTSHFDYRRLMFGYALSRTRADVAYGIPSSAWKTSLLYQEGNDAFRATLTDLLRPVFLSGQAINATGVVTEQAAEVQGPAQIPAINSGFKKRARVERST